MPAKAPVLALLMMAGLTGTLQAAEPCRARQPLWGVETGKEDQPSCGGTEDGLCAALKASLVEGSESPGPRRIGKACAGDSAGTEFWRALDNRVAVLQQGHCGDADSAGRVSSELEDLGEALGLRDGELERARKRLLKLERRLPPAEAEAAAARLEPLLARLEERQGALSRGDADAADLAAWEALEPHARRLLACAEGTPAARAFARRFQLIAPLLLVTEHLAGLAGGDAKKAAQLRAAHFGGDGLSAAGIALAERLIAAASYRFAREREAAAKGDKPRERSLPEDIPERLYKAAPRYVEFLMELTGSSRRGHTTLEHRLIAAAQELKRRSGDRAPNEAIGALVYGTHDPALAALIESAKTGSLEAWSKRVDEGLDGLATWTVPCYEAAKEAVKDRHEYSWEMGLGCVPAGPIGKVAIKGGVKIYRRAARGLRTIDASELKGLRTVNSADNLYYKSDDAVLMRAELDGRQVFVKAMGEKQVRHEAEMYRKLSDAGVTDILHGVARLPDGRLGVVTDFVPGHLLKCVPNQCGIPFVNAAKLAGYAIGERTYADIRRVAKAVERAGLDGNDLQFIITKDGRAVLIDPGRFKAGPLRDPPPPELLSQIGGYAYNRDPIRYAEELIKGLRGNLSRTAWSRFPRASASDFSVPPKAYELRVWASRQGFTRVRTDRGPELWVRRDGDLELTMSIKRAGERAGLGPDSLRPRVSFRSRHPDPDMNKELGGYYDAFSGTKVTRKSPGNHREIELD